MKIVTPHNILLDNNIISIFTSVEKFISAIEDCEADGFLRVKQEDKTLLNNLLNVDNANNDSSFLGIFYTVDPLEVDIDILWTVIEGADNYGLVLSAISQDDLFIMSSVASKNLGVDNDYLTTISDDALTFYDYAADEEDEYDEDELELNMLSDCLENWDEFENESDTE